MTFLLGSTDMPANIASITNSLLRFLLEDIGVDLSVAKEVIGKEIPHSLSEVGLHGAKAVTLSGEDEHIEAFVGFYQRID